MDGWQTILSFWGPAYFQGLCLQKAEANALASEAREELEDRSE